MVPQVFEYFSIFRLFMVLRRLLVDPYRNTVIRYYELTPPTSPISLASSPGRVAVFSVLAIFHLLSEEHASMSTPVKVGIVGLGRWAKVLTRAAKQSDKVQIVAGYSRSQEKRDAFAKEMGVPAVPDMQAMLSNPEIKGVILTVPNEQHLPMAEIVCQGREACLHRKTDLADTGRRSENRSPAEAVRHHRHRRPQRTPDGGHPHHQGKNRCRRTRPRRFHGSQLLK